MLLDTSVSQQIVEKVITKVNATNDVIEQKSFTDDFMNVSTEHQDKILSKLLCIIKLIF